MYVNQYYVIYMLVNQYNITHINKSIIFISANYYYFISSKLKL